MKQMYQIFFFLFPCLPNGWWQVTLFNNTSVFPQVAKTDDGLEAIVFTAQGDMRQVRSHSKIQPHSTFMVRHMLNDFERILHCIKPCPNPVYFVVKYHMLAL